MFGKNKIILCCLMSAMVSNSAFAAVNISDFDNNDSAVITIDNAGTKGLALNILSPDASPESIDGMTDENISEKSALISYLAEMPGEEEGKYTINIKLSGRTGEYKLQINDLASEETEILPFSFSKASEFKAAAETLISLTTAQDIKAFIETKKDELDFNDSLYEQVNKDRVAELIIKYKSDFDADDKEKSRALFRELVAIEALNTGKVSNIREIKDYCSILKSGALSTWYDAVENNSDADAFVMKKIINRGFDSAEQFENAVTEAFVLAKAAYNDGYGEIKKIIKQFESKIGISADSYADSVYHAISGRIYSDYSELVKEMNAANTKDISGGGGSGSGGGGGSRGGGGGGSFVSSKTPSEDNNILKPLEETELIAGFKDISGFAWAHDAIKLLSEKKIISGDGNGFFNPADYVKREEFVKMLVIALGINKDGRGMDFEDVKENDWFYDYVEISSSRGLINGIEKNKFGTGRNISRQDIATIIYNAEKAGLITLEEQNSEAQASDFNSVADYAKPAAERLLKCGVMSGYEDGTLKPAAFATRAETAKLIYSLIK